jgi:hypothetical protein
MLVYQRVNETRELVTTSNAKRMHVKRAPFFNPASFLIQAADLAVMSRKTLLGKIGMDQNIQKNVNPGLINHGLLIRGVPSK